MANFPRKLSVIPSSPHFDKEAAKAVREVRCDGLLVPRCVMYDLDAGKAKGTLPSGQWGPMVTGAITVILHTGEKIE